jgi:hypothetical protein
MTVLRLEREEAALLDATRLRRLAAVLEMDPEMVLREASMRQTELW